LCPLRFGADVKGPVQVVDSRELMTDRDRLSRNGPIASRSLFSVVASIVEACHDREETRLSLRYQGIFVVPRCKEKRGFNICSLGGPRISDNLIIVVAGQGDRGYGVPVVLSRLHILHVRERQACNDIEAGVGNMGNMALSSLWRTIP